ncbi:hypothetical protein A3F02_02205 [Candidatus Curtissbacteria bacterium RIFCSPHIGHO2_12_FULL_38_9b]|uniref:Bacterial spore germination immunoglobulin-like domain-containing protein n=1 Tax=Candidatus Curtissbacteria bacterium RIFCSPHIGHO2_12_FULL_38_9b TaxID=1797720 RepID=A0A1F5GVF7_9BACT|nr:MAG: hypothetical protein A3F02_02205 [Candidatus Curtissbacteria bacterium RIFCSPHIGHO2_12_FULL_38_9b]
MPEVAEKRGPIEKGPTGWPINPFGVVALLVFAAIVIFLIARPLFKQKNNTLSHLPGNEAGGNIISPEAGDIIRNSTLSLQLSADDPSSIDKVQFWAKTYADGNWQMIGEVDSSPYMFEWQIPSTFHNKAIALTSHIYKKDGSVIKDPGGWREGLIILSD